MDHTLGKMERLEQLERTVLELGTEVYRLRTEISTVRNLHDNYVEVMKGLKAIMDEKGLISSEDFENAIDLGQAINGQNTANQEYAAYEEIEKIKKTSH